MADRSRLIIAGLSSYLGCHFIERVLTRSDWQIAGLYHLRRPETDAVIASCLRAGSGQDWFLSCDFSREPETYPSLDSLMPSSSQALTFIYMCGAWYHGSVLEHRAEDVSRVLHVGLIAPIHCCSEVFKLRARASAATRCVIVTGLGGERAGVRYSSLYGSATGGIYNFVRGAGMELAGTNMSCVGLALGLFDKGQPYIHALCSQLVTRKPTPLDDVLHALEDIALSHRTGVNGSVVEVSGGMMNYQRTAEILFDQTLSP